ncbi:MAG: 3-dehydroquinate synthase [Kiritimatiellia bacterium]|jgi:3-dehydroquinate synthase
MPTIHNRFAVNFDFPVHFTENAFDPASTLLCEVFDRLDEKRVHRVAVFIDAGLAAAQPALDASIRAYADAHAGRFELATTPRQVPGGHQAKNDLDLLRDIIHTLADLHLDRQSFVLAIGGGSMLDATGLAAALVHRGLRLVRMPSTVLAQCDAGVGVKNGIDQHGQKNFMGTFAPPFAVVNDAALLASLPARERIGGLAEAVKVAIIRDAAFFDRLEADAAALAAGEPAPLQQAIVAAAAIHLRQICTGGDPFEFGSARPLDFGHWAAHRLEILSGHAIGHGRAVAVGMALDTLYATRTGLLPQADADRILALVGALGLPRFLSPLDRRRPDGRLEIVRGIDDFREHLGGRLCVTLPTAIGRTVEVHDMDEARIEAAIEALRDFAP